jgi:hypothetical protein
VIVSRGAPQLQTGSAQLSTTGNVSGFVIFRHNGEEAVVPLESRNASDYIVAFDHTNGTATGIAVNAASTGQVNIPVTVRDATGATIATDASDQGKVSLCRTHENQEGGLPLPDWCRNRVR